MEYGKNKDVKDCLEKINLSFFQGVMSPSWYSNIIEMFNKYDFSKEVMDSLFENICYIEKNSKLET